MPTNELEMNLGLLRCADERGRHWVLFSESRILRGEPGQSQGRLLAKWNNHGGDNPAMKVTIRISGLCRESEAVMTIGHYRREWSHQQDEREKSAGANKYYSAS